jgi:hypothetical protein
MKLTKTASQTTLNVTKLDFLKIGFSTGWIKKYSDDGIVEIDGKFYKDEGGITVEVEKPKQEKPPKSITISILDRDYVFQEGNVYSDVAGHYKVKDINGDKLDIVYLDGSFAGDSKTYNARDRAIIINNEFKREDARNRMRTINLNKPNQYFTLGFLAKNGRIWVEIPERLVPEFERIYQTFTGEDPKQYLKINNKVGGYAVLKEEDRKRPMELRISFPVIHSEILNNMDFGKNVNIISDNGRMEINNSDYLKNLFKLGFTIGSNSKNIQKIRSKVPPDNTEYFDQGVVFGIG